MCNLERDGLEVVSFGGFTTQSSTQRLTCDLIHDYFKFVNFIV
jgi:hypothetical protein